MAGARAGPAEGRPEAPGMPSRLRTPDAPRRGPEDPGGLLGALANRRFLALWAGQLASLLGDSVVMIAVNLLVYDLTRSAAAVALLNVVRLVPYILVTSFSGALADRCSRRALLIGADLARAGLVAGIALAGDVRTVYALWAAMAVGSGVFRPAMEATLPAVTGERRYLASAALVRMSFDLASIFGPGLAALLIVGISLKSAFVADALTFMVSALAVALVLPPGAGRPAGAAPAGVPGPAGFVADVREGFRVVAGTRVVAYVIAAGILATLPGAFVYAGTVVLVREVLRGGAPELGLLMSMWGLGAVAAFSAIGAWQNRLRLGRWFLAGTAGQGLLLLFLGAATSPARAAPLWLLLGSLSGAARLITQGVIVRATPDRLRGRVFGTATALDHAGWLVAYPVMGRLMEAHGPVAGPALAGAAAAAGLVVLAAATRGPALVDEVTGRG